MDDLTKKFIQQANERGQLTIADVGIDLKVERDPKWTTDGRYSGSDMRQAFDAGYNCKQDADPTEVFEDCIEKIKYEQDARRKSRTRKRS